MKCKKCGAEFEEGVFCPECGEKYIAEEAVIIETQAAVKKCPTCGTEFTEGIFCPECGTKVSDAVEVDLSSQANEQIDYEAKRLENEAKQIEAEKAKAEAERLEKEAELKKLQIQQEQLKKEAEQRAVEERANRTFKNVEYATIEECNKAKQDSATIDSWIAELSKSSKQKKRQEVFASLPVDTISTPESIKRLERIKEKVNVPEPMGNKINFYVGIVALAAFILVFFVPSGSVTGVITGIGGIAFWIWLIWRIIIIVKSKTKSSYLYLKDC